MCGIFTHFTAVWTQIHSRLHNYHVLLFSQVNRFSYFYPFHFLVRMKSLKTALAVALLALAAVSAVAQDTIVVQTLTFDSITTRRGTWEFPDASHTFRKILMKYTLKCDPATTADNYNCGEWDYLTYNTLYDHTGALDSTALEHPWFTVGIEEPGTVEYGNTPAYNWYESSQTQAVITSVISETLDTIGTGDTTSALALGGFASDGRTQYVWTAAELSAAGMQAGDIDRVFVNVLSPGSNLRHLTVRMRTTAGGLGDTFTEDSWTEVYSLDTDLPGTGWQPLNLHTPYYWNGIANLLVEFSYNNSGEGGSNNVVAADDLGSTTGLVASGTDNYVWFDEGNRVGVPTNNLGPAISDQITVAFWQYGATGIQPQSDYIFEGRDAEGNRVVNVHLPWGDGTVYWDAGNDGTSSYDRINKNANTNQYASQWNHWAFTKDASTGSMKIFLNGQQWHQGGGRTRAMNGIVSFNIGCNAYNNQGTYDGGVDEFCVFSSALSAAEISELMYNDIAATHPQYANLVAYYQFDETSGNTAVDASGNAGSAALLGAPQRRNHGGYELFRNAEPTTLRPQLIFAQGDYNVVTATNTVTDTLLLTPDGIVYFEVQGNDVVGSDTTYGYLEQWQYTFDANGVAIDSVLSNATQSATNTTLNYFSPPFEVIDRYEIGRYITPYGIGLDLGAEGTTWYYDVTDYAPLLQGQVDLSAGNNQELIDLQFLMIEGTPPRDVKEINRVWGERASYRYSALDNDEALSAETIALHPDASTYKVRTRLTGHGHNSNTGNYPHCCEWKDNEHYLYVDGSQVTAWHIWQATECANNPVYPQGGTWPGAREGWCPGDVVKTFDFDITDAVSGNSVTLDYDLTSVPSNNQGMGNGNYVVAMQLMQYGAYNHTLDAEIYDILSPTNNAYYARNNPFCTNAKVVLRNSGSETLTSARFIYGCAGGDEMAHEWTGSLESGDTVHVTLPVNHIGFWEGDGSLRFSARVEAPNNGQDEYAANDTYHSSYTKPDFYEENIVIELRSNNYASENVLTVRDANENIVLQRDGMENNTLYFDTLNLAPGCYTLRLDDSGLDGLSYWADQTSGNGYMRLRDQNGGYLKFFESEFGGYIQYAFSVGIEVTVPELALEQHIGVYPNPNRGQFTVELLGFDAAAQVEIINSVGQQVYAQPALSGPVNHFQVDLSGQAQGIYLLRVQSQGRVHNRMIVVE